MTTPHEPVILFQLQDKGPLSADSIAHMARIAGGPAVVLQELRVIAAAGKVASYQARGTLMWRAIAPTK